MKTRIRITKELGWSPLRYHAEYKKRWFHRKWKQLAYEYSLENAQKVIDDFLRNEEYHGKLIKYPPNQ